MQIWRTVRIFLLAASFLATCVNSVRSQSLTKEWRSQEHEIRMNRVWSLRLSFETCALNITTARMAQISSDGKMNSWQPINPNLFIIQWNQRLPFELEETNDTTYGIYDLLADYGQTRYVIQLIGNGSKSGNMFTKFFWVSPIGLSSKPIPKAPIREARNVRGWTNEEYEEMSVWFGKHTLVHQNFFREFRTLLYKADKKVELVVQINGGDCEENNANEKFSLGSSDRCIIQHDRCRLWRQHDTYRTTTIGRTSPTGVTT